MPRSARAQPAAGSGPAPHLLRRLQALLLRLGRRLGLQQAGHGAAAAALRRTDVARGGARRRDLRAATKNRRARQAVRARAGPARTRAGARWRTRRERAATHRDLRRRRDVAVHAGHDGHKASGLWWNCLKFLCVPRRRSPAGPSLINIRAAPPSPPQPNSQQPELFVQADHVSWFHRVGHGRARAARREWSPRPGPRAPA